MLISDFSIRNPVKVAVAVVLVCCFGLISLFAIPVQLTPEVVRPVVVVDTRWPGASPQEIESEIVSKQEEQLQDVEGMIEFSSQCSTGRGEVEMQFAAGTPMESTLLKVANKLDQVRDYPEDASEPEIETVSVNSSSIAYFSLVARPPTHQQLREFLSDHPELAEPCAVLFETEIVDMPTFYRLADTFPELQELTVGAPDVFALRTFAEDYIASEIQRVEGVGDCDIYGGSEDELRVVINPAKLAAYQITIAQLRDALTRENQNISGGDLWEGKRRYIVRTLGQFQSPEEVANTIVAYRDGAPVYLRDLAEVKLTSSKTQGVGHQRGVDMLTAAVKRKQGANVIDVMNGIKEKVRMLNDGLLKARGLYLLQSYDETVYIESATNLVTSNLVVGGLLAVLVLLVFLRNGRSTLVIALAIPICAVGTFLIVKLTGRSINVISLAGMAFAVGMVLDSAIVVLENIDRHFQNGDSPWMAASRGTSEVWGAILASTLTTAAVFLPVMFIEEEAGQLFRDIAIAITAGVSLSLVVSLTVIPAASARLLRNRRGEGNLKITKLGRLPGFLDSLDRLGASFSDKVVEINRRLLSAELRPTTRYLTAVGFLVGLLGMLPVTYNRIDFWPYWYPIPSWGLLTLAILISLAFVPVALKLPRFAIVLTIVVLTIGLSWKLMPDAEYLPEGNKNLVFAQLQPPPGYNIDQLESLGHTIESRLEPYWEARPGTPEAAALDGPVIDNFFLVARGSSLFMGGRTTDPAQAHELVPLLERATSGLPGVNAFVSQSSLFERNLSEGRSIEVEIVGPEITKLVELGGRIQKEVQSIFPPTTETQVRAVPSLDLGSSELHVRRNADKAAQRGVTTSELGYTVDALIDGAYAGTYWHNGREIDLVIFGAEDYSTRTQDIEQLPVGAPTGELVALGDVADVVLSAGPEQINRIDRQRSITIQVRPGPGISLESAMLRIENEVVEPLRESGADAGGLYQFRLAGTADDLRQMRSVLSWRIAMAVFITFLLIAALYESFLYPIAIMISVPLASVGGFAGLRLLNLFTTQRLDILTMLGFIILIGTVVNNAILIIDRALQLIRYEGLDHHTAMLESIRSRIRPIFMTTATTCLGMFPLVVFPGAGSELYRGLGSVVLGGLIVSTIFTLFLVPLLFCLLYELRLKTLGAETLINENSAPLPVGTPPTAHENPEPVAGPAMS